MRISLDGNVSPVELDDAVELDAAAVDALLTAAQGVSRT